VGTATERYHDTSRAVKSGSFDRFILWLMKRNSQRFQFHFSDKIINEIIIPFVLRTERSTKSAYSISLVSLVSFSILLSCYTFDFRLSTTEKTLIHIFCLALSPNTANPRLFRRSLSSFHIAETKP
jgi:hypothetical protein